ncbi:MAG: hypothetical protein KIT27_05110 [Legionellales bacterium]|nr:hypothetical protein [Legionellales bacterium]
MKQLTTIQAGVNVSTQQLSSAQKKFNRLTKGIQRTKEQLQDWLKIDDEVKKFYASRILPLSKEVSELRLKLLIQLDKWYQHKSLTTIQNQKLYSLIQELSHYCVNNDESEEAKRIYNFYHNENFDDNKKEHYAQLQAEIEEVLDVDLGDQFDFNSESSIDEFIAMLKQQAEKQQSEEPAQKAKKKPSKAEKKQAEQAAVESQSIKTIFRQLTKVLHPDREMDEQEKQRKSELMQQANIAYKKQDLLSLLELQITIEQTNQSDIDAISDNHLQSYNRVLQRQLNTLQEEVYCIQQQINFHFNIPPYYREPQQIEWFMREQQVELTQIKNTISKDLATFSDIKALKLWLNRQSKRSSLSKHHAKNLNEVLAELFEY